jgi:hypothetical protein
VCNYLSQVFANLDMADRARSAMIALRHGPAD